MRAVRADPAAVGDHVSLRERAERRAQRSPEGIQASPLLGVGHPGQHVEAAAQPLRVLPDLMRLQPAARRDGQAQQPAPGIQRLAVGAGQPVDQVPARRVALGQQHRPRPYRGQRDSRGRDSGRALVGRYGDQCHGSAGLWSRLPAGWQDRHAHGTA